MLLAIDTSTAQTGLACYDEQGLLGECVWHSGRDHSAQLLPQLSLLLRHIGRGREQISAVAVALGPGSWSGLRVGMSTAKGFALARGVPLIGVGTLDALAYQHDRAGMATVPLIRMGRERFASGTPPRHGDKRRSIEPRNVTLAEIAAEATGRVLFCGDTEADVQAALRELLGARAIFPTPASSIRRPGYLAELAWQRLQAGDTDDVAALEPIYLGQPVRAKIEH
jgi:tRNA threonylcarbamoyladenosine biosynthesis protein TsaB